MAVPLFRLGQVLTGRIASYVITKQLRDTVWLARSQARDATVVVKSVRGHPRVENERDVLKRFQARTQYLRPVIDEITDPSEPTTIVLKYLEDDLLRASVAKPLTRSEIKYVARRVLEALQTLHQDNFVHTDVKTDNIFVDYATNHNRFAAVQLGDLGGAYPADSKWAKNGTPVGATIWNSPEVIMSAPWNTATDIWSFGTVLISLIYGGDFNLFEPRTVPFGHEDYAQEVLKRQFQYFGPYPPKYDEIASQDTVKIICWIMDEIPRAALTPFSRTTEREVCAEDKLFLGKIMKLDWRDRPSATELLADSWFAETQDGPLPEM